MKEEKLAHLNNNAFYVFDTDVLHDRICLLRDFLGSEIQIAYAVKANPFLVSALQSDVERFEICSPGESAICDRCGIPSEMTVISGVYKTPSFIASLIEQTDGRIYTVESLTQFELLRTLSSRYRKKLRVLLRLTNDSQFGINPEDIEQIIRDRERTPFLDFIGVQFFSGTQKHSIKKLKRELAFLDTFFLHLDDAYGYHAAELEYGPGFPVSYFESESFDEESFLRDFSGVLHELHFQLKITLEIGRSIAASCGTYYTHIVDLKENKGQNYLIVDGGMHHIVYFGQYMGMNHPAMRVIGKENCPMDKTWNICGSLCSMNDILAKAVPLPSVDIGDVICFEDAGSYCMTEGIGLFLSRELPAVYLVSKEKILCARQSTETYPFNMPNLF